MSYQSWLDKANENLAAAQLCFNHGHFNACANRLYYAEFHAGAAVLVKNGFLPPEEKIGHDWLQANFSEKLIHRRKVFPAKFRSYLSEAFLLRMVADYRTRFTSKDNVSRELKKAKELVKAINLEVSNEAQS
ncbi:MAG: HEPN domain-containing protein [candidate division KSB1 bacterium]|nr:HEPN domain-containing protein [candidate division KSB1 bacterium]MDZ7301462.1 HEPN domain-containing protein [candidate division KSB1 bacterium]MDZ7310864.1 HEPN domain-containing protein [candidate division KSB1 bacterium]